MPPLSRAARVWLPHRRTRVLRTLRAGGGSGLVARLGVSRERRLSPSAVRALLWWRRLSECAEETLERATLRPFPIRPGLMLRTLRATPLSGGYL